MQRDKEDVPPDGDGGSLVLSSTAMDLLTPRPPFSPALKSCSPLSGTEENSDNMSSPASSSNMASVSSPSSILTSSMLSTLSSASMSTGSSTPGSTPSSVPSAGSTPYSSGGSDEACPGIGTAGIATTINSSVGIINTSPNSNASGCGQFGGNSSNNAEATKVMASDESPCRNSSAENHLAGASPVGENQSMVTGNDACNTKSEHANNTSGSNQYGPISPNTPSTPYEHRTNPHTPSEENHAPQTPYDPHTPTTPDNTSNTAGDGYDSTKGSTSNTQLSGLYSSAEVPVKTVSPPPKPDEATSNSSADFAQDSSPPASSNKTLNSETNSSKYHDSGKGLPSPDQNLSERFSSSVHDGSSYRGSPSGEKWHPQGHVQEEAANEGLQEQYSAPTPTSLYGGSKTPACNVGSGGLLSPSTPRAQDSYHNPQITRDSSTTNIMGHCTENGLLGPGGFYPSNCHNKELPYQPNPTPPYPTPPYPTPPYGSAGSYSNTNLYAHPCAGYSSGATGYPTPSTPSSGYTNPNTPSSSYPNPNTPSSSYANPNTPSSSYPNPNTPSSSYPNPNTPGSSYANPNTPGSSYANPSTPNSCYPNPTTPSSSYPNPTTPSSSYGNPSTPSSAYANPTTPSSVSTNPSNANSSTSNTSPSITSFQSPPPLTNTINNALANNSSVTTTPSSSLIGPTLAPRPGLSGSKPGAVGHTNSVSSNSSNVPGCYGNPGTPGGYSNPGSNSCGGNPATPGSYSNPGPMTTFSNPTTPAGQYSNPNTPTATNNHNNSSSSYPNPKTPSCSSNSYARSTAAENVSSNNFSNPSTPGNNNYRNYDGDGNYSQHSSSVMENPNNSSANYNHSHHHGSADAPYSSVSGHSTNTSTPGAGSKSTADYENFPDEDSNYNNSSSLPSRPSNANGIKNPSSQYELPKSGYLPNTHLGNNTSDFGYGGGRDSSCGYPGNQEGSIPGHSSQNQTSNDKKFGGVNNSSSNNMNNNSSSSESILDNSMLSELLNNKGFESALMDRLNQITGMSSDKYGGRASSGALEALTSMTSSQPHNLDLAAANMPSFIQSSMPSNMPSSMLASMKNSMGFNMAALGMGSGNMPPNLPMGMPGSLSDSYLHERLFNSSTSHMMSGILDNMPPYMSGMKGAAGYDMSHHHYMAGMKGALENLPPHMSSSSLGPSGGMFPDGLMSGMPPNPSSMNSSMSSGMSSSYESWMPSMNLGDPASSSSFQSKGSNGGSRCNTPGSASGSNNHQPPGYPGGGGNNHYNMSSSSGPSPFMSTVGSSQKGVAGPSHNISDNNSGIGDCGNLMGKGNGPSSSRSSEKGGGNNPQMFSGHSSEIHHHNLSPMNNNHMTSNGTTNTNSNNHHNYNHYHPSAGQPNGDSMVPDSFNSHHPNHHHFGHMPGGGGPPYPSHNSENRTPTLPSDNMYSYITPDTYYNRPIVYLPDGTSINVEHRRLDCPCILCCNHRRNVEKHGAASVRSHTSCVGRGRAGWFTKTSKYKLNMKVAPGMASGASSSPIGGSSGSSGGGGNSSSSTSASIAESISNTISSVIARSSMHSRSMHSNSNCSSSANSVADSAMNSERMENYSNRIPDPRTFLPSNHNNNFPSHLMSPNSSHYSGKYDPHLDNTNPGDTFMPLPGVHPTRPPAYHDTNNRPSYPSNMNNVPYRQEEITDYESWSAMLMGSRRPSHPDAPYPSHDFPTGRSDIPYGAAGDAGYSEYANSRTYPLVARTGRPDPALHSEGAASESTTSPSFTSIPPSAASCTNANPTTSDKHSPITSLTNNGVANSSNVNTTAASAAVVDNKTVRSGINSEAEFQCTSSSQSTKSLSPQISTSNTVSYSANSAVSSCTTTTTFSSSSPTSQSKCSTTVNTPATFSNSQVVQASSSSIVQKSSLVEGSGSQSVLLENGKLAKEDDTNSSLTRCRAYEEVADQLYSFNDSSVESPAPSPIRHKPKKRKLKDAYPVYESEISSDPQSTGIKLKIKLTIPRAALPRSPSYSYTAYSSAKSSSSPSYSSGASALSSPCHSAAAATGMAAPSYYPPNAASLYNSASEFSNESPLPSKKKRGKDLSTAGGVRKKQKTADEFSSAASLSDVSYPHHSILTNPLDININPTVVLNPINPPIKRKKKIKAQDHSLEESDGGGSLPKDPSKFTSRPVLSKIKGDPQSPWAYLMSPEILLKIFQFAMNEENCIPTLMRLSRVCRVWRDVSLDLTLWHTADLSVSRIKEKFRNERKLYWLLENRLSRVRHLNLSGWTDAVTTLIMQRVGHLCNGSLVSLNLAHCNKLHADNISSMLASCDKLERLDLTNIMGCHKPTPRGAVGQQTLVELFERHAARLTHLSLAHNTLSGLPCILSSLATQCSQLEVLDLSRVETVGRDCLLINLERLQEGCPQLRVLRLSLTKAKFCPATMGQQAASPGFPALEHLYLATDDRQHIGACDQELERILKTSTRLTLLDVRGCLQISDGSLVRIPPWNIEHLYLSGGSSVKRYSDRLELVVRKWAASLQELDLAWTGDGEVVDAALCAAAEDAANLRVLNLCGSSCTVSAVRRVLRRCLDLGQINLSSCRALPRGIKRLYQNQDMITLRNQVEELCKEDQ